MTPMKNDPPKPAIPGTFLAITFLSGGQHLTSYGEVTQADDGLLRVRCLRPSDFEDVVMGKALRVRFPFAGRPGFMEALFVGCTDNGVTIRLSETRSEESRRVLLRGGSVLPIHVSLSNGGVIHGRTVNVSAGGAMAVLSQLPLTGDHVLFSLNLPDEPSAALQGRAKVAWSRKIAGENQVGLMFMALETQEIRRLCRLAFRAAAQAAAT
jgi:hypothetical protein